MVKLSAIVPVYNAEKFIARCLDSILKQTFSDFEVLVVNDGSTDKSLSVCQQYAAIDERIQIFNQSNHGVSVSRNIGLKHAAGEYLSMIDADDFIEPDMFEIMIHAIEDHNADVAICGMNYYSDNYEFKYSGYKISKAYTAEELIEALWGKPNLLSGSCANKIFRNRKTNPVYFNEKLKYCEDIMFLLDYFPECSKGIQIDACLYNVLDNELSATRKNDYQAAYRIINASYTIQKYTRHYSEKVQAGAADKFLDDALRYCKIMQNSKYREKDFIIKKSVIKYKMLLCILSVMNKKILSESAVHGYLYGLMKL